MKAGLLTSTYLEAMGVVQLKQSYQDHAMDEALQARMYVSYSVALPDHKSAFLGEASPFPPGVKCSCHNHEFDIKSNFQKTCNCKS